MHSAPPSGWSLGGWRRAWARKGPVPLLSCLWWVPVCPGKGLLRRAIDFPRSQPPTWTVLAPKVFGWLLLSLCFILHRTWVGKRSALYWKPSLWSWQVCCEKAVGLIKSSLKQREWIKLLGNCPTGSSPMPAEGVTDEHVLGRVKKLETDHILIKGDAQRKCVFICFYFILFMPLMKYIQWLRRIN